MLYTLFNRRQSKALAKLTDFDDIRALGPLLNAKNHVTDFKTTDAIYNALKRLLPTIKASDRCLLSDAGYTVLLSSLSGCYSAVSSSPSQLRFEDYYIAVLKAMEQIGDERALGIVEKIASITPKRGAKLRIHSAATECLSALLTRANAEGLGLLRPTEEQSDDNLLRPAMRGIHSLQHNQLLRAGHKDDK
jgi:hypothetical protein